MLLQKKDSSNLCTYALKNRDVLVQKNRPFTQQKSPLSELQLLVKQARKTLVDPILTRFEHLSPEPSSSEEEVDPEEVKRRQERDKIRHLKNRKIYGAGLSFPASSTLSLKSQGTEGVFIRHDVDDETMEVDIDVGSGLEGCEEIMDGDLRSKTNTGLSLTPITETMVRIRRPTIKKEQSQHPNGAGNTKEKTTQVSHRSPKKKSKSFSTAIVPGLPTSSEDITPPENPPEDLNSKRKSKDPKPKPETYKQSWSVSEQNLLEQLLEEIPDGEKFRHALFLFYFIYLS